MRIDTEGLPWESVESEHWVEPVVKGFETWTKFEFARPLFCGNYRTQEAVYNQTGETIFLLWVDKICKSPFDQLTDEQKGDMGLRVLHEIGHTKTPFKDDYVELDSLNKEMTAYLGDHDPAKWNDISDRVDRLIGTHQQRLAKVKAGLGDEADKTVPSLKLYEHYIESLEKINSVRDGSNIRPRQAMNRSFDMSFAEFAFQQLNEALADEYACATALTNPRRFAQIVTGKSMSREEAEKLVLGTIQGFQEDRSTGIHYPNYNWPHMAKTLEMIHQTATEKGLPSAFPLRNVYERLWIFDRSPDSKKQ